MRRPAVRSLPPRTRGIVAPRGDDRAGAVDLQRTSRFGVAHRFASKPLIATARSPTPIRPKAGRRERWLSNAAQEATLRDEVAGQHAGVDEAGWIDGAMEIKDLISC